MSDKIIMSDKIRKVMSDKMGRPTEEKKEIRITIRVDNELGVKLQREAQERGMSISDVVRERLKGQPVVNFGGLFDEELEEISDKLGMSQGALVQYIRYMVENGYLYSEDGTLRIGA